jgi:GDP-4-dehydro-6-deoxy-D-mannose reductase
MPKILVTGVNGFVGKHLVRELSERGSEVVGLGREVNADERIADILSDYYSVDLTSPAAVNSSELAGVDAVISLAGLAKIGDSFKDPEAYMRINVDVLRILGEKLLKDRLSPRIIAVSTGAVYDSAQKMPLTETSRLIDDGSPYVKSKIKMEAAAADLSRRGLNSIIARPFNHSGPQQEPGFLLPDLYVKIRQAKITGEPLKVGNLDTKRDYTDVRDVVKAYAALALNPSLNFDLYNICSGRSITGRQILEWLQKAMGTSLPAEQDESLLRPNDPPEIYGSYQRLADDTGWKPQIPISQTVEDLVESMAGKFIK